MLPNALWLSAGATTVQCCHGDAGHTPIVRKGSLQLAASSLAPAEPQQCAKPQILPLSNSLNVGSRHACGLQMGDRMGMPAAAASAGKLGCTQGFSGVGGQRRRARWDTSSRARPRRKPKPLYEAEEEAAGSLGSGPGPDPLSP